MISLEESIGREPFDRNLSPPGRDTPTVPAHSSAGTRRATVHGPRSRLHGRSLGPAGEVRLRRQTHVPGAGSRRLSGHSIPREPSKTYPRDSFPLSAVLERTTCRPRISDGQRTVIQTSGDGRLASELCSAPGPRKGNRSRESEPGARTVHPGRSHSLGRLARIVVATDEFLSPEMTERTRFLVIFTDKEVAVASPGAHPHR